MIDDHSRRTVEDKTDYVAVTDEEALELHRSGRPGKIEITPTKPLTTQRDLSLAYSPGVAAPCLAIRDDPNKVFDYTAKGNLVAVISNGTAVLGLGNLGALGAKPVMEGKSVLFKRCWTSTRSTWRSTPRTWMLSSSACACSVRPSAASISRTSGRLAASSSSSGCANAWTFRCSTTTSTAPRSSPPPA